MKPDVSISPLHKRLILLGILTSYSLPCSQGGFRPVSSSHLCHFFDAVQSIFRQVELDCANLLEAVMLIQAPSLLRGLQIARKTNFLRKLCSPSDQHAASTALPMLPCSDEQSQVKLTACLDSHQNKLVTQVRSFFRVLIIGL